MKFSSPVFAPRSRSALNSKRNADLPIESIAPEDIGKYPRPERRRIAAAPARRPDRPLAGQGHRGPDRRPAPEPDDAERQHLPDRQGVLRLGRGRRRRRRRQRPVQLARGHPQRGNVGHRRLQEPQGVADRRRPGRHHRPQDARSAGAADGLQLRRQRARRLCRRDRQASAPTASRRTARWSLSYKFSPRFAFTGSVSYDVEDTHTKEYQQANRNQWLITNSATPPYVGALTPAGLTTLPNNQYYIDPQLGYFSDIFDHRKTLGASAGIAAEARRCDHDAAQLFLFAREREQHHLFGQGLVQRPGVVAGRPAAGHRSDPAVRDRREQRPAARGAQRQRCRDADAVPKEHVRSEQHPVEHGL